jgi:hypothetical protein
MLFVYEPVSTGSVKCTKNRFSTQIKNETAHPRTGHRSESVVYTYFSRCISSIGTFVYVLAMCDGVHRKYISLSDLLKAI